MTQTSDELDSVIHVRPRFQLDTLMSSEEILDGLKSALDKEDSPCNGRINTGYATLYLPYEEQHFWSPQLSLNLEDSDQGCHVRGLYGPRPSVWTMFVFFYALIGFATMIISIIGLSNLSMNKSAGILWVVPVLVLIFLSLYLVAYFGKKMGKDQMIILHNFTEEATGIKVNDSNQGH